MQKSIFNPASKKKSFFKEHAISLSPDNINEAKAVVEELKKQNIIKTLQKNPLIDISSIKVIQNSNFFQVENKKAENPDKKIDVTIEEIENAFLIINPKEKGKKISSQQFMAKMSFLSNIIPDFDPKILMNNKNELTSEELLGLLKQVEHVETETTKTIFQALDKNNEGKVDLPYLCELMEKFGIESFGEQDYDFLLECLDIDNDGVITIDDFQKFIENENK